MDWLGIALCSLVATAGTCFAWAPLWHLQRLTGVDAALLDSARNKQSQQERLTAIVDAARQGSWAHDLATELASCSDDPQRMAAANEALADADHMLELRSRWPTMGIRLVALAGLLGLICSWLVASWQSVLWALPAVVVGVLACLAAQRAENRQRQMRRQQADEVVQILVGSLYHAQVELPLRRSKRRRR